MPLTLTDEQERLVHAQVDAGLFASPSQAIDAALDLLELGEAASPAHRLDAAALRARVLGGLAEADAAEFASDDEVSKLLAIGAQFPRS